MITFPVAEQTENPTTVLGIPRLKQRTKYPLLFTSFYLYWCNRVVVDSEPLFRSNRSTAY